MQCYLANQQLYQNEFKTNLFILFDSQEFLHVPLFKLEEMKVCTMQNENICIFWQKRTYLFVADIVRLQGIDGRQVHIVTIFSYSCIFRLLQRARYILVDLIISADISITNHIESTILIHWIWIFIAMMTLLFYSQCED